jgi:hypothetical protein
MAAELLVLNVNGPGGRKKGAIINIKFAAGNEEIIWGKEEKPPIFRIFRIQTVNRNTIDPDWMAFGGRISKYLIDDSLLTAAEKTAVDNPGCYRNGDRMPERAKKRLSVARLKALKKSNVVAWNEARAAVG